MSIRDRQEDGSWADRGPEVPEVVVHDALVRGAFDESPYREQISKLLERVGTLEDEVAALRSEVLDLRGRQT